MDDAVVGIVDIHVLADDAVAVEVFLGLHQQGAPGAQVAPTEIGRADEDFLCLLHDGIVDGNALAFGEALVYLLLLLFRSIDRQQVLENAVNGWLVHAEGIHDGTDAPDEDAGIPEIAAVADVLHGSMAFS